MNFMRQSSASSSSTNIMMNNNNNNINGYSNLNPNSKPFNPRMTPNNLDSMMKTSYRDIATNIGSSSSTSISPTSSSGISSFNGDSIGILDQQSDDIKDDFGLRGLARAVELQNNRNSSLKSSFTRSDLGLSPEVCQKFKPVHENFESPFSTSAICGPMAACHKLPPDYLHDYSLVEKLPRMERMPTELLFFFFYVATQDALQLMAACELFDRGWRYNKISQVWIGRFPNCPPEVRTDQYENGYYQFFNVKKWKRERTYMTLHYDQLMERTPPPIPMKQLIQPQMAPINPGGGLETSRPGPNPELLPALNYTAMQGYARKF